MGKDYFSTVVAPIQTGGKVAIDEIRAERDRRLRQIKREQERRKLGNIIKVAGIGFSLYDSYKGNKKIIDYAQKHEYESDTNAFGMIFGEPTFRKGKEKLTLDQMRAKKFREELDTMEGIL